METPKNPIALKATIGAIGFSSPPRISKYGYKIKFFGNRKAVRTLIIMRIPNIFNRISIFFFTDVKNRFK